MHDSEVLEIKHSFQHLQKNIGKEEKVSRLFYHFCGASVASKFEQNLIRRLQSALMTNNGKEVS
jgi:hypothetical protein